MVEENSSIPKVLEVFMKKDKRHDELVKEWFRAKLLDILKGGVPYKIIKDNGKDYYRGKEKKNGNN